MKFNEYTTEVTCAECGHTGQYVMRTLIDTAKDKEAINKILDARWFTYTCPDCKERTIVTHTCLFHDTQRKVLIALADSEEDYEKISGWIRGTYQKDELEQVYLFEEGTETKAAYGEREVTLNRLKLAKRDGTGTRAR